MTTVPLSIPVRRALLKTLALAIGFCTTGGAWAQAYPSRPVTLIVPFTPGTGPDILARTLALKLGERLGQGFVVENRAGVSGNLGADVVAKAAPNGATLMVTVNTFTITPALYKKMPYDPIADFTPITRLANGNMALVVNPAVLPVRTLDELVAYAKARPGKLNYGSPGNGTPQHLAVELLKQRLGLDLVHVPYKGAAGANTDLLGGQIQLMVLPVHTALPFAKAGKLQMLAVSGSKRSVLAPDVATFAELGLADLGDIGLYFWLAGPAGLPKDVVEKLQREVDEIMKMPDVRESLIRQGLEPALAGPAELGASIRADIDRWKRFIAVTGITAD